MVVPDVEVGARPFSPMGLAVMPAGGNEGHVHCVTAELRSSDNYGVQSSYEIVVTVQMTSA